MESTPTQLKSLCDELRITLSTAESVSVGRLPTQIGTVSGASSFFRGGIVAYHIDVKVLLLGVERTHAEACNCVSQQVAMEMARGVRKLLDTDIGVSITGYAEPYPQEGVEEPYAWVGFSTHDSTWAERVEGPETWTGYLQDTPRENAQDHFAWMALEGLTNYLEQQRSACRP